MWKVKGNCTLHIKGVFLRKASLISLFILSISGLAFFSYKKGYLYNEIDSYALPVISIQYRASIFMNESDLLKAQKDFPKLYKNINSFEDLRSAKLMVTKSGKWASFYFPVVAIGSLPFKILLSVIGKNQEYCFILFNIFCVSYLLLVIMTKKDFSFAQKLIGTALIYCSPLFLYVRYIGAETMIFVLASISMLRTYEHRYNRAAIAVTIAGLANPTVMFLGIASIIDFIIYFFQKNKKPNLISFFKTALKTNVLFLILCFVPSFIPFIVRYKTGVGSWFSAIRYNGMFGRWLSYIFDINLGFCSFCPILVLLLFFVLLIHIKKGSFRILIFYAGIFGTMICYSMMPHINSGMLYCARYVFWTYGMLLMIILLFSFDMFRNSREKKIVGFTVMFSCVLSCVFFGINTHTHVSYTDFHKTAKIVMSNFPSLYNPLHSTFYNRTRHIDDDWNLPTPVIYADSDGFARKILASQKDADILKESLKTSNEKDKTWLIAKINKLTDKNSYISIAKPRDIGVYPLLSDSMRFYGEEKNGLSYALLGLSNPEEQHTWTYGKTTMFSYRHPENCAGMRMHARFNLANVYHAPQHVKIRINGSEVFSESISDSFEFDYEVPRDYNVKMIIELPDAISPASVGESSDSRSLSLGLRSIEIKAANELPGAKPQ